MLESKLNHEAVEDLAATFSNAVCNSFFKNKEAISGKEIVDVSPVKQVNYFVLKILFRNWQKETLRLQSPYFNYRNEEVRKALISFMNTLSQQISVKREHFEPLLRQASREAILLILSPYDFFREELTGHESGRLNSKYLKNSDKYIKVNRHFFEAFKARFEAMGEGDLDHEDALALWDDVFMSVEKRPEDFSVHEEAFKQLVDVNFADLWQEEVASSVEEPGWSATAPDEVDDDMAGDADDDDDLAEEDQDLDVPQTEIDDDSEEGYIEDQYKTLEELEAETGSEESSPAPFRFVDKDEEFDEEEDSGPLNRQFSSGKLPLHQQLKSEKGPSLAEIHQSQRIESIIGSISINQRYMFVNELFGGESEIFATAMTKVESCGSFDEAVELLIQNYAREHGWDMNAPEVKELLKIIFKKFR